MTVLHSGTVSHFVSCFSHSEGGGDLGCPTAIHNTTVAHQVTNHTQSIVKTALGFLHNLKPRVYLTVEQILGEWNEQDDRLIITL